jgi:hypothetical protein
MSALKARILTKRRLKEAGVKPEKYHEQMKEIKGTDESQKEQYQKFEKKLVRLQKRKDDRKARYKEEYSYGPESDSDSEDTDQLVVEVQKVEQNIKYFMSEIAKAKKDIDKYDRKLTRRLQKKHRRRLEEKKRIEDERIRLGIAPPTEMTMKEELEEAAFRAIDHALNDFKKQDQDYIDRYESPVMQEPQPMRLRDYDDAPSKHPRSVAIDLDEDEQYEEDKEYPDSNGGEDYQGSEPDYDSSKNLENSPNNLLDQNIDHTAVSQNDEDIKVITKPEFTQFMNLTMGKCK